MMSIYKKNLSKIDYLMKLPSNHELLVISFFVTNPEALVKLKAQWDRRDAEHKRYLGRSKEEYRAVSSKTFGGSISLIDPNRLSLGFISEIKCPVATGTYYHRTKNLLYVGSNKWVRKIKHGKIIDSLGNNLFNDIHSLSENLRGNLLITSSGVDAILEINLDDPRKIVWDWFATENGYNKTPTGKVRVIDRELNYQKLTTTTPEHTTHINSCLNYKQNKILATLFHQGELVEIDIETKRSKILLRGLKCPHFIRGRREGYLISDTRNNRVLLLDKNFKIRRIFKNGYDWVQDTIELSNGNFVIGDSNNDRIVRVDESGKELEILQMEKSSRKIFSFLTITKNEAVDIFGIKNQIKYHPK